MDLPVGTIVTVNSAKWSALGPWRIIKVNPTTYKLENQQGAKLNASHGFVRRIEGATAWERSDVRAEGLRAGVVVQADIRLGDYEPGTLFVVIKNAIADVHLAVLGGDERNRYWKVSPARLTIFDIAGKEK